MEKENEPILKAYALEVNRKAIAMTLFKDRDSAIAFAENYYAPDSEESSWDRIRKEFNLKVVKVVVSKEKW